MPNSSVTGTVTDDLGSPVAGILVGAFEYDGFFGERLLRDSAATDNSPIAGFVRTQSDGTFRISYKPGTYKLQVRICSENKRVIARGQVHSQVTQETLALPDPIIVLPAVLNLWSVADGAFASAITGSKVSYLVDNEECWSELIASVDKATTSIHWMLFYLDIGKSLLRFDADPLMGNGRSLERSLGDAAERGVNVRIVCNQLVAGSIALPYPTTTASVVADWFANDPFGGDRVEVRKIRTPALTPIHTKFVVIDNREAFVIGSPFVQDYYDSSRHTIDDARRGSFAEILCDSHGIKQPTHDVSLHLLGPAIGPLNETFSLHWNDAKPPGAPDLPPIASPAPVEPNATIQVTRSLAGNGRFPGFPQGETVILDSYLRAIGRAEKFIYLENQYFTCEEIADALILAVKRAQKLKVIFLTNNAVDIPGYSKWHPATILRVRNGLTQEDFARVGFFTLWSHEAAAQGAGKTRICRNYVHSKVAIVDDLWATVGSANLDGDSLVSSQNAVRAGWWNLGGITTLLQKGVTTENRESETNVVIYNGVDGYAESTLPADLRRRLWAEHLGLLLDHEPNPLDPSLKDEPAAGWLELWKTRAAGKLAGLMAPDPTVHDARILQFPVRGTGDTDWPFMEGKSHEELKDSRFYLRALGIDDSKLDLKAHYRRFVWGTRSWGDSE